VNADTTYPPDRFEADLARFLERFPGSGAGTDADALG